ncbi:GNAT domain-containing protein [Rostrohypoxylon terebratum]|nr:GNAT domain-containing protein [Rostrohypoxylon terebratum]
MRVNKNIHVLNGRIALVPYEKGHVPKYHRWMEDDEIRQATASERLTLEEEYENQVSWRAASDKLTFIICDMDPATRDDGNSNGPSVEAGTDIRPESMIGDVNMFLSPWTADSEEEAGEKGPSYCVAEVDIMIAEPRYRSKGLGRAAVALFLLYVRRHLGAILNEYRGEGEEVKLKEVCAKINKDNAASIALFKSLGFTQRGEANYFGEVEFVLEAFGQGDFDITESPIGKEALREYREMLYRSKLEVWYSRRGDRVITG